MYTVAVVMVGVVIIPMVVTLQELVTLVGHNPHHTTKETMPIDISHMLHGELVVMALENQTEVLEDVKASL